MKENPFTTQINTHLITTTFYNDHVEHHIPCFAESQQQIARTSCPWWHTHCECTQCRTASSQQRAHREKWTVDKELGRGGFGTVGLQKQTVTGKLRAVKEVRRDAAVKIDPARELTAMVALSENQTNFAKFIGWYQNDMFLFIVMEYFELGDLGNCIQTAISEGEAQTITFQIAEAINFMHSMNFTHRDLKPSNIFVATTGPVWWVKVADFGISKRHSDTTQLYTMLVCSEFAAPELLGFSDEATVTRAVDMWSLGCLAAWLLVHEVLLQTRYMFAFSRGHHKLPLEKLEKFSEAGRDFVAGLLVYEPHERLTASTAVKHRWLAGKERISERNITLCKLEVQAQRLAEKLFVQKTILKPHELAQPRLVCAHRDCVEYTTPDESGMIHMKYKTICLDPCFLENVQIDTIGNPEIMNTTVFRGRDTCSHCSHHWQEHLHVLYELKDETTTIQDLTVKNVLATLHAKIAQQRELPA